MTDSVYLVAKNSLYAITLDGGHRQVASDMGKTVALARYEQDVLALENGVIYFVNVETGQYAAVSSGWEPSSHLMSYCDGHLLLIDRGVLYDVSDDGTFEVVSRRFSGTTFMASTAGKLYVIEDGALEAVNHLDGSYSVLQREVGDVTALTAMNGKVYYVHRDGDLFEIDPEAGEGRRISDNWPNTSFLAACDSRLVALSGSRIFAIDPADGSFELVSADWFDVKAFSST